MNFSTIGLWFSLGLSSWGQHVHLPHTTNPATNQLRTHTLKIILTERWDEGILYILVIGDTFLIDCTRYLQQLSTTNKLTKENQKKIKILSNIYTIYNHTYTPTHTDTHTQTASYAWEWHVLCGVVEEARSVRMQLMGNILVYPLSCVGEGCI